jgi:hypothetical protein
MAVIIAHVERAFIIYQSKMDGRKIRCKYERPGQVNIAAPTLPSNSIAILESHSNNFQKNKLLLQSIRCMGLGFVASLLTLCYTSAREGG